MLHPARRVYAAVLLTVLSCGSAAIVLLPAGPAPAAAADEKKPRAKFEVYQDKAGQHRWRLRSLNKQILATSGEGYKEKRDCLAAIESVKKAAADAPVEEQPADPGA